MTAAFFAEQRDTIAAEVDVLAATLAALKAELAEVDATVATLQAEAGARDLAVQRLPAPPNQRRTLEPRIAQMLKDARTPLNQLIGRASGLREGIASREFSLECRRDALAQAEQLVRLASPPALAIVAETPGPAPEPQLEEQYPEVRKRKRFNA